MPYLCILYMGEGDSTSKHKHEREPSVLFIHFLLLFSLDSLPFSLFFMSKHGHVKEVEPLIHRLAPVFFWDLFDSVINPTFVSLWAWGGAVLRTKIGDVSKFRERKPSLTRPH